MKSSGQKIVCFVILLLRCMWAVVGAIIIFEIRIYFFNGTIDEVAQYNLVLNAEQVASHFELGSTGADNEETPAISISRNADGTVTVTFDGTLQSAPTVNGPWTDVPGESPINLSPEQAQQFGRAVR